MSSADAVNKKLEQIFQNGRFEVGLEVGTDPGLSPDEYIQVPASLKKRWYYRTVGANGYERQPTDTSVELTGKTNWVACEPGQGRILVHEGKYKFVPTTGPYGAEVDDVYRDRPTHDDVRRFIVANSGHLRESNFTVDEVWWVHACRFWSLVTGLVAGSKQKEYVDVADPTGDLSSADAIVDQVTDFGANAITAAAARTASWRKSNHATGGNIAVGFPRRWLSKNGFWKTTGDRSALSSAHSQSTSAFYSATHAVAVHNSLAFMAPSDSAHWAVVDPAYGFVTDWDIKESTSIRISPKTQVAGSAIVVDSMVVLKMLVNEAMFPMLESAGELASLASAYRQVEKHGICAASYAAWFLNGHPTGMEKVAFSQKDASFSSLVGELAAVARLYYRRSTIGESPALENAMQQLATETAKNRWTSLARAKQSSTNNAVMSAYARIAGASSSSMIRDINSKEEDRVRVGVDGYNAMIQRAATAVGMTDPPQLDASQILKTSTQESGAIDTPETDES